MDTNKKLTILLVEDEFTARNVLSQGLSLFGYDVVEAENGKQALQIMENSKPDIIISDIYMPEMNGLEFLKAVRLKDHQIPFILITGYNPDEALALATSHNVKALLLKPFRLQQLKRILEQAFVEVT